MVKAEKVHKHSVERWEKRGERRNRSLALIRAEKNWKREALITL